MMINQPTQFLTSRQNVAQLPVRALVNSLILIVLILISLVIANVDRVLA